VQSSIGTGWLDEEVLMTIADGPPTIAVPAPTTDLDQTTELDQARRDLSLGPRVRQFGSDDLLVLFAYRATSFGKVNGASLR
jgi:hypothetical protein